MKCQGTNYYVRLMLMPLVEFRRRFQILCYNCNLGRSRNGGVCPHKQPFVSAEVFAKLPSRLKGAKYESAYL